MNVKPVLSLLALLSFTAASAQQSTPSQPYNVHAVMFEMTINANTGIITHAQAVGGYPSLKDCNDSKHLVMVLAKRGLEENEIAQLQCFNSFEQTNSGTNL